MFMPWNGSAIMDVPACSWQWSTVTEFVTGTSVSTEAARGSGFGQFAGRAKGSTPRSELESTFSIRGHARWARLRVHHETSSTAFARLDKHIQIPAIDEHATQSLPLAVAFPRSQRRHFNDRNQALQDVIACCPEAAPEVR